MSATRHAPDHAWTLSALAYAEGPVTPLNADVLLEMLRQSDEKHDEAHSRLRRTLTDIADRVDAAELRQANASLEQERIKAALAQPPDLTRSVLPTRLWVTVLLSTLAIVVSMIWAASSVKSDVRDQATIAAAEARLNDERVASLRLALDDLKKDAAMQRVQTESLTKLVIGNSRK